MKKSMIMAAGIALMAFAANAQTNKVATENVLSKKGQSQYFSLGPVAGVGHSWVSGIDGQQFKPTGYLGIELLFSKFEHWGYSTNLVVSHEGYRMDYLRNNTTYTTTIDPVYLRMTPKAYYFFGRYGSNVRPKIFLGPSIAVKLTEDQHTTDNRMVYEVPSTTVVTNADFFKTVDVGVEGGVGVNVKIASHVWFNIDGSYYNGLVNATEAGNMNRNAKLDFGFMFGL